MGDQGGKDLIVSGKPKALYKIAYHSQALGFAFLEEQEVKEAMGAFPLLRSKDRGLPPKEKAEEQARSNWTWEGEKEPGGRANRLEAGECYWAQGEGGEEKGGRAPATNASASSGSSEDVSSSASEECNWAQGEGEEEEEGGRAPAANAATSSPASEDVSSSAYEECNWARCDACQKWRRLPTGQEVDEKQSFFCLEVATSCGAESTSVGKKESFFCLKVATTCEEPEDEWDEETEPDDRWVERGD
ncbi:hypothetical protein T484DRAFT_1833988 [Baffinella frigidus]|nr:hypothetical protein T484DRAFT_1833988 [Cryptophyta sp. CCMP2293]